MLTVSDSEDTGVAPDDIRKIVTATSLTSIRVDEIQAGPVATNANDGEMHVSLNREDPSFAVTNDGQMLLVKLAHRIRCVDREEDLEETEAGTSIRISHILEFSVDGELEVTSAMISAFVETNAYFIAYPYVRQMFTSLTA